MSRSRNIRGFTLLELLICLAIIGLLVGLVVAPGLQRLLDQPARLFLANLARDLEQRQAMAMILTQTEEYHVRVDGIFVYRPQGNVPGEAIDFVAWPTGLKLDTDYNNQNTNFQYLASGVVKLLNSGRLDLRFVIRGRTKVEFIIGQNGITVK